MQPTHVLLSLSTMCITAGAPLVRAQCQNVWQPTVGSTQPDGPVHASLRWDPDGAGPAGELLVVAGRFRIAGDAAAPGIATFDPASGTWAPLGRGAPIGHVRALAVLSSGELVAGGDFSAIGVDPAQNLAIWNGTSWQSLGGGTDGPVHALLARSADLVVGGAFTQAGGTTARRLALWNGAWSELAGGVHGSLWQPAAVDVLLSRGNGDLVVGGDFDWAGSQWAQNLAILGTAGWQLPGFVTGRVHALAESPAGSLLIGGEISAVGGVNQAAVGNLAVYDGVLWNAIGNLTSAPENDRVSALRFRTNGTLVVAGKFTTVGAASTGSVAQWNGTSWSAFGGAPCAVPHTETLTELPGGELFAGGDFAGVGSLTPAFALRSNGSGWSDLHAGIDGPLHDVHLASNGDLWIGGAFRTVDGLACAGIARRTVAGWDNVATVASTLSIGGVAVTRMAEMPNGELVATFTGINPILSLHPNPARWNGTAWSGFGAGLRPESELRDLLVLPAGGLMVGGAAFLPNGSAGNIAIWGGSAWTLASIGGATTRVTALHLDAASPTAIAVDIDPVTFAEVYSVHRRIGAAWQQLGSGFGAFARVRCIGTSADGALLVGGDFPAVSAHLLAWDGSSWQPLSADPGLEVQSLAIATDGRLLAAVGDFGFARLAAFDGTAWGVVSQDANDEIVDLVVTDDGRVLAAGRFDIAGDTGSRSLAELRSTCPATAVPLGLGCSGAGGLDELVALTLPWSGSIFATRTTGLPVGAVSVTAFASASLSVPLATVLPQALAGCELLVAPLVLGFDVPTNGTVETALAVPVSPALVGATFVQQVVTLELAPNGAIAAVTSSNALQATIGSF